jgi:hypothetical protein
MSVCLHFKLQEEFEHTKGVIRNHISEKNIQNNGKNKYKRTNNNLKKHTHKTKDRVTETPLNTGGELRCSGRVSIFCSTSGTRRVNLLTNPVISQEWGKEREVLTSGTYLWSFVTQISHNSQPSHGGDRKIFEMMS